MKLIVGRAGQAHVSQDTIDEFEKTLLADLTVSAVTQAPDWLFRGLFLGYRLAQKLKLPIYRYAGSLAKFCGNRDRPHFFVVMMGLDTWKCLAHFLQPFPQKSIYLFDAWPTHHPRIQQFVNFLNLDFVFVSSSMAAAPLKKVLKNSAVHWIPEGINPDEYRHAAYENKTIDVLALGRRDENYHQWVVGPLHAQGKDYRYEQVKGQLVFPTRKGLIEGLASSKISICVPSSITHPERAGGIQTMTIRYLQSMVSKCMVVGHAPEEMIELFGYNPVIEIDWKAPQVQLLALIERFTDYIPLIERNYQMVVEQHTWHCRWHQIQGILLRGAAAGDSATQ